MQLLSSHVEYGRHAITSSEQLEKAVKDSSYPPTITCIVTCSKKLRKIGRLTRVTLHISGTDPEMQFPLKTYEQMQGDCGLLCENT